MDGKIPSFKPGGQPGSGPGVKPGGQGVRSSSAGSGVNSGVAQQAVTPYPEWWDEEFEVVFESADGSGVKAHSRVQSRVAFPDRRGQQPNAGDRWVCKVCGENDRHTVYFLCLVRFISSTVSREAEYKHQQAAEEDILQRAIAASYSVILDALKASKTDVPEAKMKEWAQGAAEEGRRRMSSMTDEQRIKRAMEWMQNYVEKQAFLLAVPSYLTTAQAIAAEVGGEAEVRGEGEHTYAVYVWLHAPDAAQVEAWKQNYQATVDVERYHLAPMGRSEGQFSGEELWLHWESSDGDMYSNRGGSEWIARDATHNYEPFATLEVWKAEVSGVTNHHERLANFRRNLEMGPGWAQKLEDAKAEHQRKEAAEQLDAEQSEAARERMRTMVKKHPLPQVEGEQEWLGYRLHVRSWIDNPGYRMGPQTYWAHVCPELDGFDFSGGGKWGDVRSILPEIEVRYLATLPQGAVIPEETREDAEWRLQNWPWQKENLPSSLPEGVAWDCGYHQIITTPGLETEPDAPDYNLVAFDASGWEMVVGSIRWFRGPKTGRWFAEVTYWPHQNVELEIKAGRDPRLIDLKWEPVKAA